ncbi:Nuclear factor related to kappa-B-binding protein [Linum grandiflorum]
MAIEKNNFKVSRFDPDSSPNSRDTVSSDDDEHQRRVSAAESDDEDDEFDDADSGAGSDDFDLLELGETGAEFCQLGDLTCSVPFELYDLSGLQDILSVNVWNDVLTEEERFCLTKYLPDMDELTFMRTLKELFEGANLHFGSPVNRLFEMLKGGLCEPRVALYREGLTIFQKRQHYHLLRKHQNNVVINMCQTRDAWLKRRGYSIDEKLKILNTIKSQKMLMSENVEEDFGSDSSEQQELADSLWGKRAKDRKGVRIHGSRNPSNRLAPNPEIPSLMPPKEQTKYGRQNAKGMLKLAASRAPSFNGMRSPPLPLFDGMEVNARSYGLPVPLPRQNRLAGYETGNVLCLQDRKRTRDDYDNDEYEDNEEAMHLIGAKQERIKAGTSGMDKSRSRKVGKNKHHSRTNELDDDSFMGSPFAFRSDLSAYGRHLNASMQPEDDLFNKPPNIRHPNQLGKRLKYPEMVQQFPFVDQRIPQKSSAGLIPRKGSRTGFLNDDEPWHKNKYGEAFSMGASSKYEDFNSRSKNWSPEFNVKGYGGSSPQVSDRVVLSEFRDKRLHEKGRRNFVQNGGPVKGTLRGKGGMYMRREETESDSSEQFDEGDDGEEDNTPLIYTKPLYSRRTKEASKSSWSKSRSDFMKASIVSPDMQDYEQGFEGETHSSKNVDVLNDRGHVSGHLSRAKQKMKIQDTSPLESSSAILDHSLPFVSGNLKDDSNRKGVRKLGKNGRSRADSIDRLQILSSKSYPSDKKHIDLDSRDNNIEGDDDIYEVRNLADEKGVGRMGKRVVKIESRVQNNHDNSEVSLLGCNSVTKKRKAKLEAMDLDDSEDVNLQSTVVMQIDECVPLKKKGKKKARSDNVAAGLETPELPPEIKLPDLEVEIKPQKKPYIPITPTVHTGFSFSVVHLLSAVRLAMVTRLPEDALEVVMPIVEHRQHVDDTNGFVSPEIADANATEHAPSSNVPSLTSMEIVDRVKSNPGDPNILETQEPLQALVRGVLRIFSSKTAPLGAKGWKALVVYERSTKRWSWIGPLSQTLTTDTDAVEQVTSPEYWGVPHKMLVKLVDSFANWLKSGQETLQQLGSLPEPPLSLMQCNLDEKERFRDLRAQKSLSTISPNSEEVRCYFRKEEFLRYSIPERAFSYTAADGKKTFVAPLKRCGGKPTSKAREHFMLKQDRPPQVTILCLVRDAAARLPGSIGTRADVCTLIRDSQYIVEEVSDEKVNQIVSGALDRLHYERDPCVLYDSERKLWVYLHRDREEEDFEDDGTSSTKKWKRQKKDSTDQTQLQAQPDQQGGVTMALNGTGDQSGFELGCSDLNTIVVDPPGVDDYTRDHNNGDAIQQNMVEDHVSGMSWDGLSLQDEKLLCQENSTFGEPPGGGLYGSSL